MEWIFLNYEMGEVVMRWDDLKLKALTIRGGISRCQNRFTKGFHPFHQCQVGCQRYWYEMWVLQSGTLDCLSEKTTTCVNTHKSLTVHAILQKVGGYGLQKLKWRIDLLQNLFDLEHCSIYSLLWWPSHHCSMIQPYNPLDLHSNPWRALHFLSVKTLAKKKLNKDLVESFELDHTNRIMTLCLISMWNT
jgi:hypothetical protein